MSKIGISENLSNMYDQLDDAGKMTVQEMLAHYMDEYKRMKMENPFDLISVAHTVQKEVQKNIDNRVKLSNKEGEHKVSCRQGCSFCCYLWVDITDDEALLLTKYAQENKIDIDYDRLEKQLVDNIEEFNKLPLQVRRCPFLDNNGSCKVYDVRPTSCRTLNVVSDPKLCDTSIHKGGKVLRLADLESEAMSCATTNATESGNMAKMLLQFKK
jgi:Fe-S-cluster containining protein